MNKNVLKAFLAQPEPDFQWQCLHKSTSDNYPQVTVCELSMTSQRWRESSKAGCKFPLWQHRLELYLPEQPGNAQNKPCLLMVNGGYRHDQSLETTPVGQVDGARLCHLTKSPVACIRDIPNQPLTLSDGKPRTEDDLVAWSWQQFLQSPERNAFFPLQWPMVKAIVKAMDVLEAFCLQNHRSLSSFVVTGGSKRGLVSWLAASCDNRISAIIPFVIDVLNVKACIRHHLQVYNGWAEAIADYADPNHDVLSSLENQAMDELLNLIDPIHYLPNLTLPALIVNASSDEFFPPDSAQFYYHQLEGVTTLRYLPGASHYLVRDSSVNLDDIMASLFGPLSEARTLPGMTWKYTDQGGISFTVDSKPSTARVWLCHNPDERDFRKPVLQAKGLNYLPVALEPDSTSDQKSSRWVYQWEPKTPEQGWLSFFIEVQFENTPYPNLYYTSGVRVLPDVFEETGHEG